MREQARQHLEKMRVNVPSVDTEVAKLAGGQRQAIAIARAIMRFKHQFFSRRVQGLTRRLKNWCLKRWTA